MLVKLKMLVNTFGVLLPVFDVSAAERQSMTFRP